MTTSVDNNPFGDPEPGDLPFEVESLPRPSGAFKRLIVCCDGTWKSSDKGDEGDESYETNVTRMCRAIATEDTSNGQRISQIVYYQSGVGTGAVNAVSANIAGGTGLGLEENVMAAYHFLVNNYDPGDEIFFFGFSRGSFTARSIAGLVSDITILRREVAHAKLPGLWKRYKSVSRGDDAYAGDDEMAKLRAEVGGGNDPPKIKVIGCWDTVGSLGIPENVVTRKLGINRKYKFHNTALSPQIENAFHALALDEHRGSFSPTLWYIPTDLQKDVDSGEGHSRSSTSTDYSQTNLKQCWFPGVHTDVGRGYDDHVKGDFGDLSFAWMLDQCQGLLGFVPRDKIDMMFDQHDFKTPIGSKKEEVRRLRIQAAQVYGGASVHNSMKGIFRAGSKIVRTPGQYRFAVVKESKDDFKWYNPKRWWRGVKSMFRVDETFQGDTREVFHPSVRAKKLNDPSWVCEALEGFKAERNGAKWTWVKEVNGKVVARIEEDDYPKPGQISRFRWYNKIRDMLETKGSNFPDRLIVPWYKFWVPSHYVSLPASNK